MKHRIWLSGAFLAVLLLIVASAAAFAAGEDLRICAPGEDFLIIGHMGAPLHAIENTLDGFKKALDLGANAIETDLSLTKDGEVVLWHDWSPNSTVALVRQAGKQGLLARPFNPNIGNAMRRPVPELTLAQLREHYGYTWRTERSGTSLKLSARIPTIEEFCTWMAGEDRLKRVFFDIKIPDGKTEFVKPLITRVAKAIRERGLEQRVILMSPYHTILSEIAPLAAEANLPLLHDQELPGVVIVNGKKFSTVAGAIELKLGWGAIGRPVATLNGYSIYKKILQYDMKLARIHNFNKGEPPIEGVIAWTLDKPSEMRDVIRLGVKGIMTNRPDLLQELVSTWKE
ncbi:MAG TPA: glycerophosphodiester phosphodiesterase family protein [Candidatus Ozemobacteraceae bacterium]